MTYKKVRSITHLIILLLPLLLIVFSVYRLGTYDIDSISSNMISIVSNMPFFDNYYDTLKSIVGFSNTSYFDIAYSYFVYLFIVEMISLIFDFVLFIPRWFRGVMRKYEN